MLVYLFCIFNKKIDIEITYHSISTMEQNKYQNGLIYTIKTDNGIYVGSTCDFAKRKRRHKSCCFNENSKQYNLKVYKNIRENGGEYSMEIYKMFPCNSNEELIKEEEKTRKYLNANLNTNKCFVTEEEKKEWMSQYRDSNKEYSSNYIKQYYENNKEKLNNKSKQYYEKNKEEIKKNSKEYRENNKEIISKKQSERITCECGCETTKSNISRHRKSKNHVALMNKDI